MKEEEKKAIKLLQYAWDLFIDKDWNKKEIQQKIEICVALAILKYEEVWMLPQ